MEQEKPFALTVLVTLFYIKALGILLMFPLIIGLMAGFKSDGAISNILLISPVIFGWISLVVAVNLKLLKRWAWVLALICGYSLLVINAYDVASRFSSGQLPTAALSSALISPLLDLLIIVFAYLPPVSSLFRKGSN